MISAVCWVPKGALNPLPTAIEPLTQKEIDEALKSGVLERSTSDGEVEDEEQQQMEINDGAEGIHEAAHALAAARALGRGQDKHSGDVHGLTDGLQELNMDAYDDEDDVGFELFSSGIGDAYYPSNEMDPYMKRQVDDDDDDEDEKEDMTIKPTDGVIVSAHNEGDYSFLNISIYEESEDGDPNMYAYNEIILSALPLCTAWLDCNLKSGDKGNFIAVGSMDPAIEIWDLDLLDGVQPFMVLGGTKKKCKAGKKAKYKEGSHTDSVLGVSWNKEVRNVLASASADKSVKVWDMVSGQCALTVNHHEDKVQAVAWNPHSPEVLLSGSFDQTIAVMDMRSGTHDVKKCPVKRDVESLAWDPFSEHSFVVSLDNGIVQGFDTRRVVPESIFSFDPTFTLHAHEKATTSVSYSPSIPKLLATGSMDKMVKLWDLSNNQPSCVASKNPKAGAIFSLSFSADSPFCLAIGGAKGKLQVWDTLTEPAVSRSFGKHSNRT